MKAIPRSRYLLFFAIALAGTVVDLGSKHWIFDRLWPEPRSWPMPREIVSVWSGYFELELSLNPGALFGIGEGMTWLFSSLSVVAFLGIIFWLFRLGEARNLWLCIALAMVTGGIFGNLFDRLGLHGLVTPSGDPVHAVRDWILWRYGENRWPNFNIADCLLVCGAAMIAIEGLRDRRHCSATSTSNADDS